MTVLFLLIASCTSTEKDRPSESSPVDSHDSGVDTSPETGTDSTSDTGADESDSNPFHTAESAETGDTGVAPSWLPGDAVPGWEDFDCTETAGAQVFETRFPDLFSFVAEVADPSVASWDGPHYLTLKLRDCVSFSCADTDTDLDLVEPYVLAALDGTWGDPGEPRGQGWWGPDATGVRRVEAAGNGPLESWSDGAYGSFGTVTVCVGRARPDEVSGAVRVEVSAKASTRDIVTRIYPSIIYRFPFSVSFDDHAGFDATAPDAPADKPSTFDAAHFTYDLPYADAWPWDDITDPAIRAAVYERYTPYNAP